MKVKYYIGDLQLRRTDIPREWINIFLELQKELFKKINANVSIYFDGNTNTYFPIIFLTVSKDCEREVNIKPKLYRKYLDIMYLIKPFI